MHSSGKNHPLQWKNVKWKRYDFHKIILWIRSGYANKILKPNLWLRSFNNFTKKEGILILFQVAEDMLHISRKQETTDGRISFDILKKLNKVKGLSYWLPRGRQVSHLELNRKSTFEQVIGNDSQVIHSNFELRIVQVFWGEKISISSGENGYFILIKQQQSFEKMNIWIIDLKYFSQNVQPYWVISCPKPP